LTKDQENNVFDLIGRLIQTLSSPKIAIDERHTPKLYARFLAGLLSRHRRDGATVGRLQPVPPSQNPLSGDGNKDGNGTGQLTSAPIGSSSTSPVPEESVQSQEQSQEFNQASLW
jgi:hypothetical protein